MPRSTIPVSIFQYSTRRNRVAERIAKGHTLCEAEEIEGISWDGAVQEGNREAIEELVEKLDNLCGDKAACALGRDLWKAGCRRHDDGEWYKGGVKLESPQGIERFPTPARRLRSFSRLLYQRALLTGGVHVTGTEESFKIAVLNAFEAGIAFAESASKGRLGRKRERGAHKRRLMERLDSAERAIMKRTGQDFGEAVAKDIFAELKPPATQPNGKPYAANSQATLVAMMRKDRRKA